MEDTMERALGLEDALRERLATDIHDGPIQRLTAVALTLDLFVMRLDGGDLPGAREYAEPARRDLAAEMTSPAHLDDRAALPVLCA